MPDRSSVFKKLSNVDVKPYVKWSDAEDNGKPIKLPYLPWQNAHALMMENYPDYEWAFDRSPEGLEVFYFADTTAEVRVTVSVGNSSIHVSKSVTGYNNKPVQNPNADDIHNAKMRCRVRALAELGLGWDLWLNHDNYPFITDSSSKKPTKKAVSPSKVGDDAKYQSEKSEEEAKQVYLEKVAKVVVSKETAKKYKPKAGRQWANRKWDEDEFHERWEVLLKAKGLNHENK
jgi:hypothetical protein